MSFYLLAFTPTPSSSSCDHGLVGWFLASTALRPRTAREPREGKNQRCQGQPDGRNAPIMADRKVRLELLAFPGAGKASGNPSVSDKEASQDAHRRRRFKRRQRVGTILDEPSDTLFGSGGIQSRTRVSLGGLLRVQPELSRKKVRASS